MSLKNRIGKFYLTDKAIEQAPEIVKKVMSKVIIVKAEHLFHKRQFEYYAVSEVFDEVKEGCEPPLYDVYAKVDDVIVFRKAFN